MNIPYYTMFSHRIMHNSANDIFMFVLVKKSPV